MGVDLKPYNKGSQQYHNTTEYKFYLMFCVLAAGIPLLFSDKILPYMVSLEPMMLLPQSSECWDLQVCLPRSAGYSYFPF